MHFDARLLSRPDLALLAALLILCSSLAVGFAGYVAVLEGLWLTTHTDAFLKLRSLWSRAFLTALAIAAAAAGAALAVGAWAPAWASLGSGLPYRPAQLVVSALLASAAMVAAVSAARLWRHAEDAESGLALKMAIGMFVICAPLEIAVADAAWARPQLIVGVATAAALLGLWGGLLCWRSSPERSRLFLAACVLMAPGAATAPIAEWLGAGGAPPG